MDDWSLLPSRNAVSEPAPDLQSPMTTTTLPARLTRPRQAPTAGADHPRPHLPRLTRTSSPGQLGNQSGAKPQNPNQRRQSMPHRNQSATPKVKDIKSPLDNTRPFMDDTGRLLCVSLLAGAAAGGWVLRGRRRRCRSLAQHLLLRSRGAASVSEAVRFSCLEQSKGRRRRSGSVNGSLPVDTPPLRE